MKIGLRTPSLKKSISARTTGRVKRSIKRKVNPLYGKKGMGLINDPKKAVYNKVYRRTTFGGIGTITSGIIPCIIIYLAFQYTNLLVGLIAAIVVGLLIFVWYPFKEEEPEMEEVKQPVNTNSENIDDDFTRRENLFIKELEFELNKKRISYLKLHFLYLTGIKLYYPMRDKIPNALDKTITYCLKQIEISEDAKDEFLKDESFNKKLPNHTGYEQLAIIYEKQGKIKEAIELTKTAKKQGWRNDFDKRLDKLKNKLN